MLHQAQVERQLGVGQPFEHGEHVAPTRRVEEKVADLDARQAVQRPKAQRAKQALVVGFGDTVKTAVRSAPRARRPVPLGGRRHGARSRSRCAGGVAAIFRLGLSDASALRRSQRALRQRQAIRCATQSCTEASACGSAPG